LSRIALDRVQIAVHVGLPHAARVRKAGAGDVNTI
jgi:hypothetical protein